MTVQGRGPLPLRFSIKNYHRFSELVCIYPTSDRKDGDSEVDRNASEILKSGEYTITLCHTSYGMNRKFISQYERTPAL